MCLIRNFDPKKFDSRAHGIYHIDMTGHKTEDCWPVEYKIQNLIDAGVFMIDLLNQTYESTDHFKVHHASCHNLPQYSGANSFVIGNLGSRSSQAESPKTLYAYMPEDQNRITLDLKWL